MMQKKITQYNVGETMEGFFVVKSSAARVDKNGAGYLDIIAADASAEINAKLWNTNAKAPEVGSIVYMKGDYSLYSGKPQCKILALREASEHDNYRMSDLVKSAPRDPADMLKEIGDHVKAFQNDDLKKLVCAVLKKYKAKLEYYPAAQSMHHAERSGLLHHITSMLNVASLLCKNYPFLDEELLLSGVILHDLGKIDELISNEFGLVSEYSKAGNLIGHLVGGTATLHTIAKEEGFAEDNEYLLLLEHMLISHHGSLEYGSAKLPMFPEAIMLSFIDDMDAKMFVLEETMQRIPRGAFSEKIYALDRKIYHPIYFDENK